MFRWGNISSSGSLILSSVSFVLLLSISLSFLFVGPRVQILVICVISYFFLINTSKGYQFCCFFQTFVFLLSVWRFYWFLFLHGYSKSRGRGIHSMINKINTIYSSQLRLEIVLINRWRCWDVDKSVAQDYLATGVWDGKRSPYVCLILECVKGPQDHLHVRWLIGLSI